MTRLHHKKILVTGITSIHGWPLFCDLQQRYPGYVLGVKNTFSTHPIGDNIVKANAEDLKAWQKIFRQFEPDYVIHCGGLCDLDKAEQYPDHAFQINVVGAQYLYHLSQQRKMVYLSYDLIFSGEKNSDSGYDEESTPDPLTIVGKTIVSAEQILQQLPDSLIIRLALPIGKSVQGYKGVVDWINSRFVKNRVATLLYDEVRSTINVEDIGAAVHGLISADCKGIYHLGSASKVSIYQIGELVLKTHNYPSHLLEGKKRIQFPPSPPRMGDVSLNSTKAYGVLGWTPTACKQAACFLL